MSDFNDLKRQLAKVNEAFAKLDPAQKTDAANFGDFAKEYLRTKLLNPTLRKSTLQVFRNQAEKHLVPAFGRLPLDRINNGEWLQWVSDMREQKKIGRFFNARKVLIEILGAAVTEGKLEKLPKLDNPDAPRDVGRVLTDHEVLSIIFHARRPFRFIFYTFWKMGCRPREILQWEWSMIEWNEPGHTWISIPARISKTDRSRKIPINPDVSWFLKKRALMSVYVYPATQWRPQLIYHAAWKRACRRAGVKNAQVYDLRRSFVTRAAAEGQPLLYIAKFLDTSVKLLESTYAKSQTDILEEIVK